MNSNAQFLEEGRKKRGRGGVDDRRDE